MREHGAMLIVDFHLDLAMNAVGLDWDRDLTLPVPETRRLEAGSTRKGKAAGTVAFPEMRKGRVALASATVIARWAAPGSNATGHRTQAASYGAAQGQLAYYRWLERHGLVRLVADLSTLRAHLAERRAQREAVIGAAMAAWMLWPNWIKGQTTNEVVGLKDVVDHIDHVCQVTGSARHAAIGTDLDGGYGTEQCPHDLDTIADLQSIPALLRDRGYARADVEAIMHRNWLRLIERAWS